jgi:hypothetical protein
MHLWSRGLICWAMLASSYATAAPGDCQPVRGLAPLLQQRSVVLLGEMHGTQEGAKALLD